MTTKPQGHKPQGHMRDSMPTVAAWIDDLREVFGADAINPQLRHIYASEGGRTIGQEKPFIRASVASEMPDVMRMLDDRKKTAQNAFKPLSRAKYRKA